MPVCAQRQRRPWGGHDGPAGFQGEVPGGVWGSGTFRAEGESQAQAQASGGGRHDWSLCLGLSKAEGETTRLRKKLKTIFFLQNYLHFKNMIETLINVFFHTQPVKFF